MAALLPVMLGRQPRSRQHTPMTRPNPAYSAGLVWLWSYAVSTRTHFIDLSMGRLAAWQDFNNWLVPSPTEHGIAGVWNGGSNQYAAYYQESAGVLNGATSMTLIAWFQFLAAGTSYQWLNFRNNNQHSLDVFSQTSTSIYFGTDWAGAWNGASQQLVSGLVDKQLVCIASTITQTGARLFCNGVLTGTKTGSSFTVSSSLTEIFAGAFLPLYGGAAFTRALPDEHMLKITRDPRKLFAPEQRPRLISLPIGPFVYARPTADVALGDWVGV